MTMLASRPADNRQTRLPKTACRRLRPFRYLRIPPQDRERVYLVRERVTHRERREALEAEASGLGAKIDALRETLRGLGAKAAAL